MTPLFIIAAVFAAVAVIAVLEARSLYRKNRELARYAPTPKSVEQELREPAPKNVEQELPEPTPKSVEQGLPEYLDWQLEAVNCDRVTFSRRKVMNRDEFQVFRAAMSVTGQQYPTGSFPFYVFPQVSLGQIIRTQGV
jgi:hypothetical protein